MCRIVMLILIILCFKFTSYAQQDVLNSRSNKRTLLKSDTTIVNGYCKLSRSYINTNSDSALFYADRALHLAKKITFEKGIALSLLSKGIALEPKGRYAEALNCYLSALTIIQHLKQPDLRNNIYNNIGIVYLRLKDYPHALSYFFTVLDDIKKQKRLDESFEFKLLVNISEVYKNKNLLDSAILYNVNALVIAKKVNNQIGQAITLFNIADNYILKKDYSKALQYLNLSLPISQRIGDTEGVSSCFNDFSMIYYQTNNYKKSIDFALNSLVKGKELDNYENTQQSYHLLYLNYTKTGDFKKALNYRNLDISLGDSLNTLQKQKQIQNIQSDYELQRKQNQINSLEKEKAIHQKIIENEKYIRLLGAAFSIVLLLFIFQQYRSNAGRKKLNQQLHDQNEAVTLQNQQLERLNETKNVLFSIIGHDLRGPFAYLMSMIDLMKDKLISPDEQEYFLSKLSENILVTDHLLNNLLYWAKSQMEGMAINRVTFDIQNIVHQNIDLLKSRGDKKGIEIGQQGNTELITVYADEAMIDLILRNLIENAMKFSEQGDSISVNIEDDQTFIKLAIRDSGKGILLEDQPKIFNKLTSFTTYGTLNEKGSGLGLMLCKELIEKNNGVIWFESTPGQGSTFYITIPKFQTAQI